MTALDADSPLVLDTRPLRRRAGTMIRIERTVPAPAGWEVSTSRVPPGSAVDLRVRLESVVEGVLVTGTATVAVQGECSRCLDPVDAVVQVPVLQLFAYPDETQGARVTQGVADDGDEEEPLPVLEGELIDLEPTVRDAAVLDLPSVPLCSDSCPGLCTECGARLADDPGHRHDLSDSRWSVLSAWGAPALEGSAPGVDPQVSDQKGN